MTTPYMFELLSSLEHKLAIMFHALSDKSAEIDCSYQDCLLDQCEVIRESIMALGDEMYDYYDKLCELDELELKEYKSE